MADKVQGMSTLLESSVLKVSASSSVIILRPARYETQFCKVCRHLKARAGEEFDGLI